MAACVTKPIDETEMLRRIAAVLKRPDIVAPLDGATAPTPSRATPPLTSGQRRAVLELVAGLDDDPNDD